jgi:hypothetical protein
MRVAEIQNVALMQDDAAVTPLTSANSFRQFNFEIHFTFPPKHRFQLNENMLEQPAQVIARHARGVFETGRV